MRGGSWRNVLGRGARVVCIVGAVRCFTTGVDATVRTGRGASTLATVLRVARTTGVGDLGATATGAGVASICTGARAGAEAGAAAAVRDPPRLGVCPHTTLRERETRGTQFTLPSTPARM